MNKHDIIDVIAEAADISKASAEKALNAFTGAVVSSLKDGQKVAILGFGSFEASHRAARAGRNPQTGETIQIAASVVAKFKAGKALKESINEG